MKKGWKVFWIVCAVSAVIGVLCCAASYTLGVTVEAIEARYPNGIAIGPFDVFKKGYKNADYLKRQDGLDDLQDGLDDLQDGLDDLQDDYKDYDYKDNGYGESNHHENHHGEHSSYAKAGDGNHCTKDTIIDGSDCRRFQGVREIDLEAWDVEIDVCSVTENSTDIVVETKNIDKRLKLRHYIEDGELKIKTAKDIKALKNDGKTGKIIIYIPANYQLESTDFLVSAGILYVEDIRTKELDVNMGVGEATIVNYIAQEAEFNCGTGVITASGQAKKEIDLQCGVGEINYTDTGKQKDYDYTIDCAAGSITCGESEYSGFGVQQRVHNNAGKKMNIECGLGTVDICFSGK